MKYIVRTIVEAKNAEEALRLAKKKLPDEVYLEPKVEEKEPVGFN